MGILRQLWAAVAGMPDEYPEPSPIAYPPPPDAREVAGFTWVNRETFSAGRFSRTVDIYRCDALAKLLHLGRTGTHVTVEFVRVPGGEFEMGCSAESRALWLANGTPPGMIGNEFPAHRVTVPDFMMARTVVTQSLWQAAGRVIDLFPGSFFRDYGVGPFVPAYNTSWADGDYFAAQFGLRLPSEAEWEFACRAGSTAAFCFGESGADYHGDTTTSKYAWYFINSGRRVLPPHTQIADKNRSPEIFGCKARDVATRQPNAFGLFDMHGNVWEHVADTYSNTYVGAPTDGSAWEFSGERRRAHRGGSFTDCNFHLRSTNRDGDDPYDRAINCGFRLAASIE